MEGYAKFLLLLCLGLARGYNNYDLRLAETGSIPGQGRVEVYYEGEWGTVCDDFWSQGNADVVCRQLGYSSGAQGGYLGKARIFGAGSGSILLDDVRCTGEESSIADCRHRAVGTHNCGHSEDVGVICTYEIRLAGTGSTSSQGRVEVYAGQWGTVCDDKWGQKDADVVCRQLGFSGALNFTVQAATFGPGTGPINLDNVRCTGRETSIYECNNNGWGIHDCHHSEDAGVYCIPGPVGQDIRLGGSSKKNDTLGWGVVEIMSEGEWGTICGTGWTQEDANVACRQLGFSGPAFYHFSDFKFFGAGSGDILFSDVACTGDEDSITDCPFSSSVDPTCTHDQDAEVLCLGAYEGPVVRLGGTNSDESKGWGTVEIYRNGEWGTVCSSGWTQEDANVVCNQLGFPDDAFYSLPDYDFFGPGSGSVVLTEVACTGDESSVLECPSSTADGSNSNCDHDHDVEVLCTPATGASINDLVWLFKKGDMKQQEKMADLEMQLKEADEKKSADLREKDVVEALVNLLSKLKQK
nr:deleted in malignant brain tumors 1 protein-like isoform X1 [Lytechinus pictus]